MSSTNSLPNHFTGARRLTLTMLTAFADPAMAVDVANGRVTLVFDFGMENGLSGRIKEAVLLVCWNPGPFIGDESWGIGSFEGDELAKLRQNSNLIAGYNQAVSDTSIRQECWAYAIRLSALCKADASESCVVRPVLGLLSEKPAIEVLGSINEVLVPFAR